MKALILISTLIFAGSVFADEISLNPGATITIKASTTTKVSCEGSNSNSSGEKSCEILTKKAADGRNLPRSSADYQAYVFQYGQVIARNGGFRTSDLAAWCDQQLGN